MESIFNRITPVTESGCWLWIGRYDKDGYGMFHDSKHNNYKNIKAHRYFYEKFVNPIPDGKSVLHRCDIPCCVNPAHLFLGAQKDNMLDKKRKGRAPRGEKIMNSKLTENIMDEIFHDLQEGISQYKIAEKYGISQGHVSAINTGKRWSYLRHNSLGRIF